MSKLEERRKLKEKKPEFRRHDSHKKARISKSWRRPRGLQNKLRIGKRGYGRKVETGWGSPNEVKGLHPSGLEPVVVNNITDMKSIDKKSQGAVIGSSVGNRKRVGMLEHAQKNDIKILNLEAKKHLEKIEEDLKARKRKQEERQKRKKEAEKEAKKAEEKDKEAEKVKEELTEEAKKKQEKEEKDKVLTKK